MSNCTELTDIAEACPVMLYDVLLGLGAGKADRRFIVRRQRRWLVRSKLILMHNNRDDDSLNMNHLSNTTFRFFYLISEREKLFKVIGYSLRNQKKSIRLCRIFF